MRRREFITLVGCVSLTWPLAARAQQSAIPVIGLLSSLSPGEPRAAATLALVHEGLHDTGYVEGKNVAIEYRWAENQNDRLPTLAADLVGRQVSVIITPESTPAALAAKAATSTIPIVFAIGADPVATGLVTSLGRPGGNVTGVTTFASELAPKQLELLHQIVPTARVVALLVNPTSPSLTEPTTKSAQAMASILGLELHVVNASNDRDLDAAFAALAQLRVGAVVFGSDAFFSGRVEQLAALAIRYAVPSVYWRPEFAAAGGLMSYGTSSGRIARQAGVYAGRIIKGERPASLPVQQVTTIELVINLKTAKALGLTIPPTLLARADKVIE